MKRNVKIKAIVAIVAAMVICLAAFIPLALQESELNNLQQTAIAELNGEYDKQSIVLEDTNKVEAEYLAEKFGAQVSDDTTILYGGSCKPSNAKELFAQPDIDGGLIGGAALKAADFIEIAKSF